MRRISTYLLLAIATASAQITIERGAPAPGPAPAPAPPARTSPPPSAAIDSAQGAPSQPEATPADSVQAGAANPTDQGGSAPAGSPGDSAAAARMASPPVPAKTDSGLRQIPAPAPAVQAPVVPAPAVQPPAPSQDIEIAVDTSLRATGRRSRMAAVGLSLLLPGAGQRYLGHRKRAQPFLASEIVFWGALFGAMQLQARFYDDARSYANRHAGAQAGGKDEDFLELMGAWRSRRNVDGRHGSYDESLILSGMSTNSRYPDSEEWAWDWGSPENPENDAHFNEYRDILRATRATRVAISFAAGALVLSRTISAIDAFLLHRRASAEAGDRIGASATLNPVDGSSGAYVMVRF